MNGKNPRVSVIRTVNSLYLLNGMALENHLYSILFYKVYFIDYAIIVVPLFAPHYPPLPCTAPLTLQQSCPPQFMSMGHTYKFFGYSIPYTILNHPLSILCLCILLLILCTFPLLSTLLSPLITLPVIFISVILFLF